MGPSSTKKGGEKYIVVKKVDSLLVDGKRKHLHERNVLRHDILITEIQRSCDDTVDVVVGENKVCIIKLQ